MANDLKSELVHNYESAVLDMHAHCLTKVRVMCESVEYFPYSTGYVCSLYQRLELCVCPLSTFPLVNETLLSGFFVSLFWGAFWFLVVFVVLG